MNGVNDLKDVLDYIDIGITDNNNKDHYILYIYIYIYQLFIISSCIGAESISVYDMIYLNKRI